MYIFPECQLIIAFTERNYSTPQVSPMFITESILPLIRWWLVLKNQNSDTYIDPAFAPDIWNLITSILYGEKVIFPKKSKARHIASLIGINGIDSAMLTFWWRKEITGIQLTTLEKAKCPKKISWKNDLESIKKDSDQELVYIKEMEEKISRK